MTRQASLKQQLKLDFAGVLPREYFEPPQDMEMVFHNENGELELGQGKKPSSNVVVLY